MNLNKMERQNSFWKNVTITFLDTLNHPWVDVVFGLMQAFYMLVAFQMFYDGNIAWQNYPHNIIFNIPLCVFGLLFLAVFIVNLFKKFRKKR